MARPPLPPGVKGRWNPANRCTAARVDGQQCARPSMSGRDQCATHLAMQLLNEEPTSELADLEEADAEAD